MILNYDYFKIELYQVMVVMVFGLGFLVRVEIFYCTLLKAIGYSQ